jgi:peptidoglycan hydrolase CwlO-like protein
MVEYGSLIIGTIIGITIGIISVSILNIEKISNEYLKLNELLNKLEKLETKIHEIENFNKSSQEGLDELKLELKILNEEIQEMLKKKF